MRPAGQHDAFSVVLLLHRRQQHDATRVMPVQQFRRRSRVDHLRGIRRERDFARMFSE
ncbi:hypothetical protein D1872_296360 [compost metagenome]